MSKRSIEETNIESLNFEFEYDDSENQLRKKIKLENQKILEKIKEINDDIDISEHEVHKLLLTFHTLVEIINSQELREETNGFVTDTIMQIVSIIAGILKKNTDSQNIPAVLKNAIKKLKSLFIPQTKDTEEGKTGEPEPENARNLTKSQETSEVSGDGAKEQ